MLGSQTSHGRIVQRQRQTTDERCRRSASTPHAPVQLVPTYNTVWQTGSPFDVFTSASYPAGDYNADGQTNDRPNTPTFGTDIGSPSQEQWRAGVFTAADFPRPAAGTVGDLPRNVYRGPGCLNTDLSLVKRFALPTMSRDAGVQVRVEAYNLFNTINLNSPVGNLSSTVFGRVTSARPSREIQLGVRLTF